MASSSFEQIESYYKIKLPDDLRPWHDLLSKSGLLGKGSYIRLLQPAEVIEAKGGVMTPDLIPIFKDIYGNALGWRESPADLAGGGWYWYNHEGSALGSLGPSFRGMLRAVALALACRGAEDHRHGSDGPHYAVQPWAEAKTLLSLPHLFDGREQMIRCVKEIQSCFPALLDHSLGMCMRFLVEGVVVPLFVESVALWDWRNGCSEAAARIWGKALEVDRTSCLLHWHTGLAAIVNGYADLAVGHLATAFEGSWENQFNCFECFPGRECADLSAIANYLMSVRDKYTGTSHFPQIRELLLAGAINDTGAWRAAVGNCQRSGNLEGAKTMAVNGLLAPAWPECLRKDPSYAKFCANTLVEVYQRRGLATRVEHLIDF